VSLLLGEFLWALFESLPRSRN